MRVQNMMSNSGNKVANQFEIYTDKGKVFQSYNSVIAKIEFVNGNRVVTLDKNKWDYSKTTGKYRNEFLNETKKETEKKIKDGTYKLEDLNKCD